MFQQLNPLAASQEEEEVDDEDMGVAETYADYMPTKCKYYILCSSPISARCLSTGLSFLSHGRDWKINWNGHRRAYGTSLGICKWTLCC